MSRAHAVRECLHQAVLRLRPANPGPVPFGPVPLGPATPGPVPFGPATAADIDAPETGRVALHGHG